MKSLHSKIHIKLDILSFKKAWYDVSEDISAQIIIVGMPLENLL